MSSGIGCTGRYVYGLSRSGLFFLLDWGLPPSATKRVARSCSGRDRIASASGPTRPRRTAPRGRRGFYDDNDEKRKRGGRKNEKGKRGGSGACLPVRKGEGAKGRAPPSAERHDLNGNHKASHSDNGPPPTTPVQPLTRTDRRRAKNA